MSSHLIVIDVSAGLFERICEELSAVHAAEEPVSPVSVEVASALHMAVKRGNVRQVVLSPEGAAFLLSPETGIPGWLQEWSDAGRLSGTIRKATSRILIDLADQLHAAHRSLTPAS